MLKRNSSIIIRHSSSSIPEILTFCAKDAQSSGQNNEIKKIDSDMESGAKVTLKAVSCSRARESFSCWLQDQDFTFELISVPTSLRHQRQDTAQGRGESRLVPTM